MKWTLVIAAVLFFAGLQTVEAADCDAAAKTAAANCLAGVNANIDYAGIARCRAAGQRAHDECEAVNTVGSQKPSQPSRAPPKESKPIIDLKDPSDTPKFDD